MFDPDKSNNEEIGSGMEREEGEVTTEEEVERVRKRCSEDEEIRCPEMSGVQRAIIEKTSLFVATHGEEAEKALKMKQKDNERFFFLLEGNPYHDYYKYLIDQHRRKVDVECDVGVHESQQEGPLNENNEKGNQDEMMGGISEKRVNHVKDNQVEEEVEGNGSPAVLEGYFGVYEETEEDKRELLEFDPQSGNWTNSFAVTSTPASEGIAI